MDAYEHDLPASLEEAGRALAEAAAAWGADWQPESSTSGTLHLPTVAGLRRGVLVGRVDLTPVGSRCRLRWKLERTHLRLHRPAVTLLVVTAGVVLPVSAWPFYPALLGFLPLAGTMGFLAWFLVLSRLRSSGPEEFFSTLGPIERGSGPDPF